MSGTDKSKKGLMANIRRKTSFKKTQQSTSADAAAGAEIGASRTQNASAVTETRMADGETSDVARELDAARAEVQELRERVAQYENASSELDDESYDAAQAFQLKKELREMREELANFDMMREDYAEMKQELAELQAKNEELELQQSRKSTRNDMQRIRAEKGMKEELDRLHKTLREKERDSTAQIANVETQLKASKDSLQRAAEKTKALQRRLDLMDKERMDLKLENQRLTRKLEKSDSYAQKKRAQMEAETQEMEIANLKRKTSKLEKQLSMSTMNLAELDKMSGNSFMTSSRKRSDSRTDSHMSSGTNSPVPMTLSEARIETLEKEVHTLEEQNSALEIKNRALKDELIAAEKKASYFQASSNGGEEADLLTDLPQFKSAVSQSPATNGSLQDDSLFQELQQEVSKLKKELEDKDVELRVRVKEMKATNDELKQQVEDLEMEKLHLELGEDEEGENTDTEEKEDTPRPVDSGDLEVKVLRERLMSLQGELQTVSQNNDELQAMLEKQKESAEVFMKSIEEEKGASQTEANGEEKLAMQRVIEQNDELEDKLQELTQQNAELDAKIQQLTQQNIELQTGQNEFAQQREDLESGLQKLTQKNEELVSQLLELEQQNTELAKNQESTQQNMELDARLQQSAQQNKKLETQLQELIHRNESLETKLNELTQQNQKLQTKLQEQEELCDNCNEDIAHYKSVISNKEEEILLLKVQRDQLEQEVEEMMEMDSRPDVLNGDVIAKHVPTSPAPVRQTEKAPATPETTEKKQKPTPAPVPSKKPKPSMEKKTTPSVDKKEASKAQEKTKSPAPKSPKSKTPPAPPTPEERPRSPTPPLDMDSLVEEVQASLDESKEETDGPSVEQETPLSEPTKVEEEKLIPKDIEAPVPSVQERVKSPLSPKTKSPPAAKLEKERSPTSRRSSHDKEAPRKLGGILSKFQPPGEQVDSGPPLKKATPSVKKRPPRDWPPKPKK